MRLAGEEVEKKVVASTTGAIVSTALVNLVLYALKDWSFVSGMDDVTKASGIVVINALVVGATTLISGFFAKHTYRGVERRP